jgi:hypothetical protein
MQKSSRNGLSTATFGLAPGRTTYGMWWPAAAVAGLAALMNSNAACMDGDKKLELGGTPGDNCLFVPKRVLTTVTHEPTMHYRVD